MDSTPISYEDQISLTIRHVLEEDSISGDIAIEESVISYKVPKNQQGKLSLRVTDQRN